MVLNRIKEVKDGTVLVKWEPPLNRICPVVQYNVNYREEKGHWKTITVSRNTTTYSLHLHCWKQYEITVTFLSSLGESDKENSNIWNFKTGTKGKVKGHVTVLSNGSQ